MDAYLKYSEEIAEYLLNGMSPLELEAFEERMKTDPELATQVKRQKAMLEEINNRLIYQEVMEHPDYAEMDKQAREIIKKGERQKARGFKAKSFILARLFLSAATIAFLWLINRATLQITPIHHLLLREAKRFKQLWKKR